MSHRLRPVSRHRGDSFARTPVWVAAGVLALTLASTSIAEAPEPASVMRVEEDWELVLQEPDGDIQAPQFATVMSPYGDLNSFFVQVTWNYRELPEFEAGGFQVQAWNGEEVRRVKNTGANKFSNLAETITWTQIMATNGTEAGFAIINGLSTTWGAFGGTGTTVGGTVGVPDLNAYNPDVSLQNSCVTYGSNRVASLMITEIRYYDDAGNVLYTDTTPRVLVEPE